jgi:hypothetical protein
MRRAMDGDRLGTSHGPGAVVEASRRLAPSRWTTCQERLFAAVNPARQVAHTAHSADDDTQKGATHSGTALRAANDNHNPSGEV